MEDLKTRIESVLRAVNIDGMEDLLAYMGQPNSFYWCRSSGHDRWTGGTAEHSWRVYQYMLYLRDHPNMIKCDSVKDKAKFSTLSDESIALAGLLHDVGKINGCGNHEIESLRLMRLYLKGPSQKWYDQVLAAVFFHHNRNSKSDSALNKHRDCLLRMLLNDADTRASGTTWNAKRFLDGLTQHSGTPSSANYLRRVALDRTRQVLDYKMYLDGDFVFHSISGYSRNDIRLEDSFEKVVDVTAVTPGPTREDFITNLHYAQRDPKACLVIGVDPRVIRSETRNLRQTEDNIERDLLICSNILPALYRSKQDQDKHGHKYSYWMPDEVIALYEKMQGNSACLFLPNVTFFRDGSSKGFRMVEPWTCNVVLIPKDHGDR